VQKTPQRISLTPSRLCTSGFVGRARPDQVRVQPEISPPVAG
jgi:hypothetical protein